MRAEGTPGDSDPHPRWNVVARREGTVPGETVHFNSHHDVVEVGRGWTVDPFGGEVTRRQGLWPRRLRHEGRPRRLDHRGRGLRRPRSRLIPAPSKSRPPPTRKPAAMAASPISPSTATSRPSACSTSSSPSRSTRTASASAIAACGGPRSRRTGASRMARCRSSATAPSATWRAVLGEIEDDALSGARDANDGDAGGAAAGAPVDPQHQLHPWRPARARGRVIPAFRRRSSRIRPAWSSTGAI